MTETRNVINEISSFFYRERRVRLRLGWILMVMDYVIPVLPFHAFSLAVVKRLLDVLDVKKTLVSH